MTECKNEDAVQVNQDYCSERKDQIKRRRARSELSRYGRIGR